MELYSFYGSLLVEFPDSISTTTMTTLLFHVDVNNSCSHGFHV